ncbi:unnamed protein product, partial [Cladocopium goreaui]
LVLRRRAAACRGDQDARGQGQDLAYHGQGGSRGGTGASFEGRPEAQGLQQTLFFRGRQQAEGPIGRPEGADSQGDGLGR